MPSAVAAVPGRSRNSAAGSTTIAPIAGAKPTVDSSDRSNLPVMMISDSASTTRARAAEEVRIVVMLAWLRKTGLTNVPTMMSTTSAGSSARSRSRATAIRPADGERTRASATGAEALLLVTLNPLDRGDESVVAPSRLVFGHDAAMPHDQHAVAGPQILELAADDQDRLALAAHALDDGEERFLGFDVDTGGRVHEHQDGRIVGKRPTHHDLLLVAAGEAGDQLIRPFGDHAERGDRGFR